MRVRLPLLLSMLLAGALAVPASASAMTAFTLLGNGYFAGGAGADSLVVSESDGLLVHNRVGDGGFASSTDWDSSVGGVQTLPANSTAPEPQSNWPK